MKQISRTDLKDSLFDFCPFPGMRPFEAEDARYFCGRDRHIDGVIERLKDHHFVAVTGGSGSGKSSLVRAGVIPYLKLHGLEAPGQVWVVVICKPGTNPLESLKKALIATLVEGEKEKAKSALSGQLQGWPDIASFLDLYRNKIDVEPKRDKAAPSSQYFSDEEIQTRRKRISLLLLIDQFEEIFERGVMESPDTERFVDLLAPSSEHALNSRRAKRVFTIITARSENLRSLGAFPVLPDLFTQTQYHVGPLHKNELAAAIEEPVQKVMRSLRRAFGDAEPKPPESIGVDSDLIQSMVTGAAALRHDPDHLFLVQHAARAVWLEAATRWCTHKPDEWRLTKDDFDKVSGKKPAPNDGKACAAALESALNAGADFAFESLKEDKNRRLAERLFKLLATLDEKQVATRRRPTRKEVLAVARGEEPALDDEEVLEKTIAAFRKNELGICDDGGMHPFIRVDGELLDVAHEALIRKWSKFKKWIGEEERARRDLEKLIEYYGEHLGKNGEVLTRKMLDQLKGWASYRKNHAWHEAQRSHIPDTKFNAAAKNWNAEKLCEFWEASEKHWKDLDEEERQQKRRREEEDRRRRKRKTAVICTLVLGLVLAPVAVIFSVTLLQKNKELTAINTMKDMQVRAISISHAGFQLAVDNETFGNNVRLHDAITLLKAADKLREETQSSASFLPPEISEELDRSLIGAERITLAATLTAISRRVNWEKATELVEPPLPLLDRYHCGSNKKLLASKRIKILETDLILIAVEELVPYGPSLIPNQSPIVKFGFIDESKESEKKCNIPVEGGFQLPRGENAAIRFDQDMLTAMISWEAENLGPGYEYRRVQWVPICRSEEGSPCSDVGVEVWTEKVGEEFPNLTKKTNEREATSRSMERGPGLPRAHLAVWSAERPAGAIEGIDVGQGYECEEEAGSKTCKYGRDDLAVRLQTTEMETERSLHKVDVLKRETNDEPIYIEIASFNFQGPEVQSIGFNGQQQPDEVFLQLKHGLGWFEVNLQRERLLESACAELEALDPQTEEHFKSFDIFKANNKVWLGEDLEAPCPQGGTVDEQEEHRRTISQAN